MAQFAEIQSGGKFFAPKDHTTDVAILVEPTHNERERQGGKFGPKDTIHANLTYFATEADLDAGRGTEELGVLIQQTALQRDLVPLVGKATVAVVTQVPSSNGGNPVWVWRSPAQSVKDKVVEYATERDAAHEAAAADAPDFL